MQRGVRAVRARGGAECDARASALADARPADALPHAHAHAASDPCRPLSWVVAWGDMVCASPTVYNGPPPFPRGGLCCVAAAAARAARCSQTGRAPTRHPRLAPPPEKRGRRPGGQGMGDARPSLRDGRAHTYKNSQRGTTTRKQHARICARAAHCRQCVVCVKCTLRRGPSHARVVVVVAASHVTFKSREQPVQ